MNMKIFFLASHPSRGTGYSRVANKISNYMASIPGVEVVYFAFQNYKGGRINDRFIDPRIKFHDALELDPESPAGFGYKAIVHKIIIEKPDVLFSYNDLTITNIIMDIIPKSYMPPKKYVYLDIVYPWQNIQMYKKLKSHNFNHIWVFTDYWKKHLIDDLKFDTVQVSTMVHGVDFDRFIDIPKEVAKRKMGLKPDDYLIINMNSNNERKCWDITIRAFVELLKRENLNSHIKLYCGGLLKNNNGHDIIEILFTECIRKKLKFKRVLDEHFISNPKPSHLTDEEVSILYNAGDVGMNTSRGEGFGLTTIEHLYFDRPQIVSGIPALIETMGPHAHIVKPKVSVYTTITEPEGGEFMFCDYMDFADKLQYCFRHPDEKPNGREYVKQEYSWDHMYKTLDAEFSTQM
jgi:glycosyltransferase involved in cell wall biosynthesis